MPYEANYLDNYGPLKEWAVLKLNILNLNTHPAYLKLRNYRELIINPQNFKGYKFSRYLDKYAIIGFDYVKKINLMIKNNNLEKFNSLRFKSEN